jgi:MFS family permease
LIWALTQFPMIGSVGLETLVACRIALGAGEGPAAPVTLHSAYKWFPNELRTLPTAVIVQGGATGVLVALPLLNWVIARWTWHWAFGALGLVWCGLWLVFGREGSPDNGSIKAKDAAQSSLRVGYAQLLLSPTILACWTAAFGANWALSLALSRGKALT